MSTDGGLAGGARAAAGPSAGSADPAVPAVPATRHPVVAGSSAEGAAGAATAAAGAPAAVTELVLLRHGVTAWNRARRFQGHIDIPLDAEGHRQARLAARRLAGEPVAAVYSSDLGRAVQTAQPIAQALGLPLATEPGLRERHYGLFEGLDHDTIEREHPDAYARWRAREPDFALPGGGETLRTFSARVEAALRRLVLRHPGVRVVAVTHGGVLDCAYRLASGLDLGAPRRHDLLNASLNRLVWDGERFRLCCWADVAHLESALDDVEARG